MLRLILIVGAIPLALGLLGWLGLQIQPASFPAYDTPTPALDTVALPPDLPAPVARYYREISGDAVPVIDTAVITGRATLRFMGIPFPSRLRFTHEAGRNYRHYIESTIFGLPLLRVNEYYLDGKSRLELPFGVVESQPKVDSAANLGLWGETIWLSPVFATDSRVRWEAIDDNSARLIVPAGDGDDSFIVQFDPDTGLLHQMETMRWKDAADTAKTGWLLDVQGWQTMHGVHIPSPASVTWADEAAPWLVVTVEDVALNVPVAEYIRASGL